MKIIVKVEGRYTGHVPTVPERFFTPTFSIPKGSRFGWQMQKMNDNAWMPIYQYELRRIDSWFTPEAYKRRLKRYSNCVPQE